MSLTRYQQLPYPPSRRVRGNGASDVEALAVKVDSQLDRIGAQWTTVAKPDSVVYTLSGTVTGVINGSNNPVTPSSLVASWGDHPPSNAGPSYRYPTGWGWYDVNVCVSTVCSGTANTGTRRTLLAYVFDNSGTGTPVDNYTTEELEQNLGEVILQLQFVTLFDKNYSLELFLNHTNTSSTVNITTTSTYINMTRLAGVV